jgi:carbamate kinase
MDKKKPIIVIALGGNALIQKGQIGTASQQLENLQMPMKQIAQLADRYRLIITHGNGPQVGNLLLQQESCNLVPKMPLEIIGAMTQGQIGYMIESSLDTALMEIGTDNQHYFITLLTYVVVDENDPGFKTPTKPIGPFYTQEQAANLPYTLVKTDKGYRRVVASPKPLGIVEQREIKRLIEMDFIVICTGGGGIPVIRQGRRFTGVEAVIDKDLASSVLAQELDVDIFLIATDTEGAAIHWGKPEKKFLKKVTLNDLEAFIEQKHFAAGSMGPKVQAIQEYFKKTGKRGIICQLKSIPEAIEGKAGTEIV